MIRPFITKVTLLLVDMTFITKVTLTLDDMTFYNNSDIKTG